MWPHPRVRVLEHESDVLRGNPAGDPHVRDVAVILPPGYDDEPRRRYPVAFVLTGFTGTGLRLLNVDRLSPSLPERMDRLVMSGRSRPLILILPDCWTRFGGSQYLDSTATGRYEEYVAGELVALVDRSFRTLSGRAHRGVVGKSSGGYGALRLAMRRPEVFGAAASHAGDCWFELCYKADFPALVAGLARYGGSAERFMEAFPGLEPKTSGDVSALNVIAMAAAYSPNPERPPLGLDLPCDPVTGELDEAVWRRWLEHDPVHLAGRHAGALRSLRLLYLDAGTRDEYHLHLGARILARRLAGLGVPHLHEEFDGGHRGIDHRYDRSLPLLAEALAGPE